MIKNEKKLKYRKTVGEFEGVKIPHSVYETRKRASIKVQLFLKDCDYIAGGKL